jgi:transposase
LYDFYAEQLVACDQQIEQLMKDLARYDLKPEKHKRRGGKPKKVLSEIGADMSKFKSAKHFASWLGLCPGTKISGGKVLSAATKRTANKAAQALKWRR